MSISPLVICFPSTEPHLDAGTLVNSQTSTAKFFKSPEPSTAPGT